MKRLLIITYYWPPTGGSGVQRWLKFTKYMPSLGWQPVVYTPSNPDNELADESLIHDISPETIVLKRSIKDPSSLIKTNKKAQKNDGYSRLEGKSRMMQLAKWVRGNIFVPDSRIVWKNSSVKFLINYIKENPVDAVVTTGPPHSMHLIGQKLKKKTGLKWIMDIRDPMSQLITNKELNMSSFALNRYRKIESGLLQSANVVIATSPEMPKMLEKFDTKKFHTITNGYDSADFSNIRKIPVDPFVMTHGGLLNQYRTPTTLLSILDELIAKGESPWNKFELHLAGIVTGHFFEVLERFPHIKSRTKHIGYLSHEAILELYQKSSALLLLMNNDAKSAAGTIPGKLFEYFAAKRPILSLGPENCVYANELSQDENSLHAEFNEKDKIHAYLNSLAKIVEHYDIQHQKYEHYERKKLTEDLVHVLNKI